MVFELRKDGIGVVTAEGAMDAAMAVAFRKALIKAFDSVDSVEIDLAAVDSMDILSLQLICSARRTASALGKKFTIKGSHNALDRAELDVGYSNVEQCG